jgi:hypothetical protein
MMIIMIMTRRAMTMTTTATMTMGQVTDNSCCLPFQGGKRVVGDSTEDDASRFARRKAFFVALAERCGLDTLGVKVKGLG